MTLEDIETKAEESGYELVIFDGETFPRELMDVSGKFVRYCPKEINKPYARFSEGWFTTSYDYSVHDYHLKILYVDVASFMSSKKTRLLNAIKDFV